MSNEREEFVAGARLRAREATRRPKADEGSRSESQGCGASARRLRELNK